jgi:hypothetical protein
MVSLILVSDLRQVVIIVILHRILHKVLQYARSAHDLKKRFIVQHTLKIYMNNFFAKIMIKIQIKN